MKYRKLAMIGLLIAACGGEENQAAPVAPVAPGTPSTAVPGAAPAAVPGAQPATPVAPAAPAAPTAANAQTRTGVLGPGDETLESGEYTESFSFTWNQGESHEVRLTSSAFDPYLIVKPPTGAQLDNDDLTPGNTEAGLTVNCATSGVYRIVATTYQPGETGAFTLTVR